MDIEKKFEDLGRAFEAFKKENDARLKEIEKTGTAAADREEKLNRINAAMDAQEAEIKKIMASLNRCTGGGEGEGDADQKAQEKKDLFQKLLRKGAERLTDAELKTLSVDSDADGGFLVRSEMDSEVQKMMFESSPMRALCDVKTISSDALEQMQDLGEIESGWVGEVQPRPETETPELGNLVIPVHELYAKPKASQKILDDASFNVEAWLNEKFADKFGRDEATAVINGNGVKKPKGILSYAAGVGFNKLQQFASGSAGDIASADPLIDMFYGMKDAYVAGASWLMRRSTIGKIRKLKDENKQYLWQPSLQLGQPSSFLGAPIHEAADMPAVEADKLAVAFGNWKKGYRIVDRMGIRVLRDPYSQKPFVEFYATKRVGGGVKDFDAIKILKIASSL